MRFSCKINFFKNPYTANLKTPPNFTLCQVLWHSGFFTKPLFTKKSQKTHKLRTHTKSIIDKKPLFYSLFKKTKTTNPPPNPQKPHQTPPLSHHLLDTYSAK